jgi:polar amino acid transport system substrate-binding protein
MIIARRPFLASALAFPFAARALALPAHEIAPAGRLRVAINLGNAVLATRTPSGELGGISVDLAHEIASRLGLPLDLVPYPAAGAVFAALDQGAWDMAFLAIEAERATKVAFTAPYVVIDGTYLVPGDSPAQHVADLDRPGARIAVSKGAAYDLFLTRTLKQATLVRLPDPQAAVAAFADQHLDALAGIRQFLQASAAARPGSRVLPDSYSRIEQAIGVPRGRDAAAAWLQAMLAELKRSGRLRAICAANGQGDLAIAP